MYHKKGKRIRNRRAGCKMCKPWKISGIAITSEIAEKFSDHKRRVFALKQIQESA